MVSGLKLDVQGVEATARSPLRSCHAAAATARDGGETGYARGCLIAKLLEGAWRVIPPLLDISAEDLNRIGLLLLRSGSAGLAWWRLRQTSLHSAPVVKKFRQAFRLNTLRTALLERQAAEAFRLLEANGIQALMAKGWAASRLYAQRGLRPYGDIDLWIRAEEYNKACHALVSRSRLSCPVEWHTEFQELEDRAFDQLFARSQRHQVVTGEVRILGFEDHFRMLCLHALRHGIWRPIWLSDIAAALESLPEPFDWDYCLAGKQRMKDWLACIIALAHQLLGARLDCVPAALRDREPPVWTVLAVQQQWGSQHYMTRPSIKSYWRRPRRFLKALGNRWPNPIQATVNLRGSPHARFRITYQLGECLRRLIKLLRKNPHL